MKENSFHDINISLEMINRFELAEKLAKEQDEKLIQESAAFKVRIESKISSALFMENIQEANRLFNMLNRMHELGLRIV